ncbi:MAG: 16S rRNA (guanine(966)-N(2))-methyltransferase RsmD [Candidatus Faecivivens sp.]|nr:16S rRNA (guanine(966)-N(2))-methyltransferase RsmD [Oscillospiraceae bacterium]MDY2713514.1 16S rRNA (guanine(966)-N(2))-methyltransferase RsmD [Candidatus Faecivivens sp.]
MRVITGIARGRKLETLDGLDVRPTTEVVKEAVFSMIHFRLPGARVADIFAGSGQMGIEALSRGAVSTTFVDQSKASLTVVRRNLQSTGLGENAVVRQESAESFLSRTTETFDLIFLDPPYNKGFGEKLLPLLGRALAKDGLVLFEHSRDEDFPEKVGGLKRVKEYRYGKTLITTYTHDIEDAEG